MILRILKRFAYYMGLERQFDHKRAQQNELRSAKLTIKENFENWYSGIEAAKAKGERWPGFHELEINGFYGGSQQTWKEFAAHIEGKTCLEIGPGPCGALAAWWWVGKAIFIDPLIEEYMKISLKLFQRSVYTGDMELHAQAVEELIPELSGTIDGAIICRNTLDHVANPRLVLENISSYAAPGCYLLLWTDLWHLKGHDEGHHNITKDIESFDKSIRDLGFEIIYTFDNVRQDGSTIEYGCRARKVVGSKSQVIASGA